MTTNVQVAQRFEERFYASPQSAWENYTGFVYKITHKATGKFYIGQKVFWFKQTKKALKGYKLKRHSRVESDWREYYGSSKELLKDIETYGKDAFLREILKVCETKHELSYEELKAQLRADVLNPEVNTYNGIINVRLRKFK